MHNLFTGQLGWEPKFVWMGYEEGVSWRPSNAYDCKFERH